MSGREYVLGHTDWKYFNFESATCLVSRLQFSLERFLVKTNKYGPISRSLTGLVGLFKF